MPDVLETLKKLPPMCAALLPADKLQVIIIERGCPGYSPLVYRFATPEEAKAEMDRINSAGNLTAAHVQAMLHGSLFGWHTPGADPDKYDAEGRLITTRRLRDAVKRGFAES